MQLLTDGLVAFLAAVGLTTLLWLAADLVLSRRRSPLRAAVVLAAEGNAHALEWAVWTACAAARELGRGTQVIIADCGMDEDARARAKVVEENNEWVAVMVPSHIETHLRR